MRLGKVWCSVLRAAVAMDLGQRAERHLGTSRRGDRQAMDILFTKLALLAGSHHEVERVSSFENLRHLFSGKCPLDLMSDLTDSQAVSLNRLSIK